MFRCKVFNNLIILLVLLLSVVSGSSEIEKELSNDHEHPGTHANYLPSSSSLFHDLLGIDIVTQQQPGRDKNAKEEIGGPVFNWDFPLFRTLEEIIVEKKEEERINVTTPQMLWSPHLKDPSPLPRYFDWRVHDAVSPVKDQKLCAACWAFSVAGNIESMNMIYNNKKDVLSEKYLMDCLPDTNGCEDTTILKAYSSIITHIGGVVRKEDYQPYNGQKDQCNWVNPPANRLIHVTGFQRVRQDEVSMVEALVKHGPLSAAINSKSMANYKITARANYIDEPTEEKCSSDSKDLNHAILIVGYNEYVDSSGRSTPYWIIKNSWGSQWGDEGYYYLVRGRNACGIANDVSFAYVN